MKNRHQHDVPAGYFFPWAMPSTRSGQLFVYDGVKLRPATPGAICKQRDLYTATSHDREARFWSEAENDWPVRVRRLIEEKRVTGDDIRYFLHFATQLHVRNRIYANESSYELLPLMKPVLWAVRARDILGIDGTSIPMDERSGKIASGATNWGLLVAETQKLVLTSDNPVMRIGFPDDGALRAAMYALPITPHHWGFVYDTTRIAHIDGRTLTLDDERVLARWVCANARNAVIGSHRFGELEQAVIRRDLGTLRAAGKIGDGRVDSIAITPPPLSCFVRPTGEPLDWDPSQDAA